MGSTRAVVVTGADARFFHLVEELVASIHAAPGAPCVEIACMDLGLFDDQKGRLAELGVLVAEPRSELAPPPGLQDPSSVMGYLARPYLPQMLPGRDVYVWLDADTWIQSGQALQALIDGALESGAALIREDEATYRSNFGLFLWKGKHYLQGYGALRAARLLFKPQINNGVFAMRADAPHWAAWRREYAAAYGRTGLPAPHDQFGLNAAVQLGGPPARFLPATFNWICDLSKPWWDDEAGCFCTPDGRRRRIEVVHLAGPIKSTVFDIRTTGGGMRRGLLRYGAALAQVEPGPGAA